MTQLDADAKKQELREAMQERLNYLVANDAMLQKMQGQLDGITFMEGENKNEHIETDNRKSGKP